MDASSATDPGYCCRSEAMNRATQGRTAPRARACARAVGHRVMAMTLHRDHSGECRPCVQRRDPSGGRRPCRTRFGAWCSTGPQACTKSDGTHHRACGSVGVAYDFAPELELLLFRSALALPAPPPSVTAKTRKRKRAQKHRAMRQCRQRRLAVSVLQLRMDLAWDGMGSIRASESGGA